MELKVTYSQNVEMSPGCDIDVEKSFHEYEGGYTSVGGEFCGVVK